MTINLDFQYSSFPGRQLLSMPWECMRGPAAVIAGMAQDAGGDIWLSDGKSIVDAASIIGNFISLCGLRGQRCPFLQKKKKDILPWQIKSRIFLILDLGKNE